MKLFSLSTGNHNPYENLALENYLMDIVPDDSCILYLWQNAPTVVIGRNQNVWSECRASLLQEDGVFLARRYSGGGAVYHDFGNLNFTFVAKENCYNQEKQFNVIQKACNMLGISTELSGRNDLLANGFKFSGNAFLHRNGAACHHGTLLIDSDFSKLGNYLTPPKAKLQAKGVSSVRSRVTNLKALCPDLTVDKMKHALWQAFEEVYNGEAAALPLPSDSDITLSAKAAELADPKWLYGNRIAMTCSVEDKFLWGYIRIEFLITNSLISGIAVFTDSLDWTLSDKMQRALTGIAFSKNEMLSALKGNVDDDLLPDLSNLLNI